MARPNLASPDVPGQSVIAVIVAKNAPEHSLDKESLNLIFLRKMTTWPNRSLIQPVNLLAAHPLRHLFTERVSGLEAEELEQYWNDQYFHGIFPPYAVASEEAVIRFVAESASAIGYVSACAVDVRVRVLFYLTPSGVENRENAEHYCRQH